ncbi:MAG TPA: hypothetical protein HA341_04305 [Halobacteria archaeon]|nr:hypothetical protein [Halobacteria archaeon]
MRIKNKRFLNMLRDDNALATVSACNFCMPMAWMCCGTLIETIGGFLFGCYGKLFLLCCPAP